MMRKWNLFAAGWILFFSSILTGQDAGAGVYIEEVNRDLERTTKIIRYFSENQFRTDIPEYGLTTIVDFKGDRMVMIYHKVKRYEEIRFSQWEKMESEKAKKSMLRTKPKTKKIVVRNTGETAVINGFRTEKIQLIVDGELVEENFMTKDVNIGEVEKVMGKVAKIFMKEFRKEMTEGQEIYDKLKPHGFPVLIKDYTLTYGLSPVSVMEIIKLEKKELGDEIFYPPSDYQRIVPETPKK